MTQASASACIYHISTLISLPDIKWDWLDMDKAEWVKTNKYQQFYKHWHNGSTGRNFLSLFPYKLSLRVDRYGTSLLHFGTNSTSGNRILITKAYNEMYHCLLLLCQNDKGHTKGAVVTGQPGIGASLRSLPCATTHQHISPGKTTFLKFMLMWLVSAHQVVLLCDSTDIHLFYHGQVYFWLMESGFRYLPGHKGTLYYPIWALIDVDFQDHGPYFR